MADFKLYNERTSLESDLNTYYNAHQHQLTAARINILILKDRDPKETFAERPVAIPGSHGGTLKERVTCGEQVVFERLQEKNNLEVLCAVEDMLVEATGGKFVRFYSIKK